MYMLHFDVFQSQLHKSQKNDKYCLSVKTFDGFSCACQMDEIWLTLRDANIDL
jgi:hypothetical protein